MEKLHEYIEWDPNMKTKNAASLLLNNDDDKTKSEINSKFNNRIAFGTAGLRSAMDYGYSNMNDLVILQTCQGLCKYLNDNNNFGMDKRIIIGYDHRCNPLLDLSSLNFARLSASVFLHHDYEVLLLKGWGIRCER